MPDLKPPSGRTIALELQREMEARLYPLMYRTLPPAVYHLYLHPDDYREVEPIASLIVLDAQQLLNSRVDELNGRSRWSTLVTGRQAPIEIPPGGWEIHLHPETNGELMRGELGIESRLLVPPPPRYDGGSPTTRIARTVVSGTIRRDATAAARVDATPDRSPVPPPTETQLPAPGVRAAAGGMAGRLVYADETGTHTFLIRKDLISIGRGGSAHWVDVQIVGSTRVSREHCRIRRGADGRFFLQDVSTWGTSVDGVRIAPFARQEQGQVREGGYEHELTSPARIELADALVIEFTTAIG
jgi:hypothetical protein